MYWLYWDGGDKCTGYAGTGKRKWTGYTGTGDKCNGYNGTEGINVLVRLGQRMSKLVILGPWVTGLVRGDDEEAVPSRTSAGLVLGTGRLVFVGGAGFSLQLM